MSPFQSRYSHHGPSCKLTPRTITSKKNLKGIIGPEGTRHILLALSAKGHGHVPTVCIGGINASNTPQVLFRGSPPEKPLDGIAVVSAIVAARDPEAASRQLLGLVRGSAALRSRTMSALTAATAAPGTKEDVLRLVPAAIKAVHEQKPLSHNMTNLVWFASPGCAWKDYVCICGHGLTMSSYRLSKTLQQMSPSPSERHR